MKKIFNISAIIFVLFILCAPSCEDEQETAAREEAIIRETKNEIRKAFEADYLTETSLYAHETNAKQKINDVADCFQMLNDTTLETSFRKKAAEIIKSIFISESTMLALYPRKTETNEATEVFMLINEGLENKINIPPFSVDSVNIHEPLHRIGNTTYAGSLWFNQKFNNTSLFDHGTNYVRRKAEIYLVKEIKIFGADTLNVWTVKLGEIR
jgi:hypothetical protein